MICKSLNNSIKILENFFKSNFIRVERKNNRGGSRDKRSKNQDEIKNGHTYRMALHIIGCSKHVINIYNTIMNIIINNQI